MKPRSASSSAYCCRPASMACGGQRGRDSTGRSAQKARRSLPHRTASSVVPCLIRTHRWSLLIRTAHKHTAGATLRPGHITHSTGQLSSRPPRQRPQGGLPTPTPRHPPHPTPPSSHPAPDLPKSAAHRTRAPPAAPPSQPLPARHCRRPPPPGGRSLRRQRRRRRRAALPRPARRAQRRGPAANALQRRHTTIALQAQRLCPTCCTVAQVASSTPLCACSAPLLPSCAPLEEPATGGAARPSTGPGRRQFPSTATGDAVDVSTTSTGDSNRRHCQRSCGPARPPTSSRLSGGDQNTGRPQPCAAAIVSTGSRQRCSKGGNSRGWVGVCWVGWWGWG